MTALNKQARLVSPARISEIANGDNLIMGEKDWLANTAIYLANELKTATKAFQSTGFSLLEAEEKLESAEKRNAELEDLLEAEIKSWMQRCDSANNRREAAEKRIADQRGIILSARNFISEYAVKGDMGAAEFVKILDRAAGIGVKGE
ncbi:hypothetical protein ACTR42_000223 [Citrobacter freundii]